MNDGELVEHMRRRNIRTRPVLLESWRCGEPEVLWDESEYVAPGGLSAEDEQRTRVLIVTTEGVHWMDANDAQKALRDYEELVNDFSDFDDSLADCAMHWAREAHENVVYVHVWPDVERLKRNFPGDNFKPYYGKGW